MTPATDQQLLIDLEREDKRLDDLEQDPIFILHCFMFPKEYMLKKYELDECQLELLIDTIQDRIQENYSINNQKDILIGLEFPIAQDCAF